MGEIDGNKKRHSSDRILKKGAGRREDTEPQISIH